MPVAIRGNIVTVNVDDDDDDYDADILRQQRGNFFKVKQQLDDRNLVIAAKNCAA